MLSKKPLKQLLKAQIVLSVLKPLEWYFMVWRDSVKTILHTLQVAHVWLTLNSLYLVFQCVLLTWISQAISP